MYCSPRKHWEQTEQFGFEMDTRLSRLKATFASPETEAAYQAFITEDDRKSNLRILVFALPIYAAYIILDLFSLEDFQTAIFIRLAAFAFCYGLLFAFRPTIAGRHHEWLTLAISMILAHAVNLIIYLYTDLQDAYYVGLVQGCVFVCFLLRMSFLKSAATIISFFIGFVFAISGKAGASEAASIQTITLGSMVSVCTIGAYLLQRFRRFDFQKVVIIEEQNAQLSKLLARAEEDNKRKIAALNMLVHFIKTPLHQITGFSDILVNATNADSDDASIENARYIKTATVNLTKSINGLLNYHRLDEADSRAEPEPIDVACVIDDFSELLPDGVRLSKGEIESGAIFADSQILRAALDGLAEHYRDERTGAGRVVIAIECGNGNVIFTVRDDGSVLSAAQYEDLVQPLTEITGYLSHTGEEMPMALRTVARAVEITGGDMTHEALADGNRYRLALPAADKKSAAA